jgi:hypothetical protein
MEKQVLPNILESLAKQALYHLKHTTLQPLWRVLSEGKT